MFMVRFETDNAVFENDPQAECMRILKKIINDLDNSETEGKIFDLNGNRVGEWKLN